ncbi:MAG: IPT/TIG domain-containing protein [Candidatus Sericytochromatia bacterium]
MQKSVFVPKKIGCLLVLLMVSGCGDIGMNRFAQLATALNSPKKTAAPEAPAAAETDATVSVYVCNGDQMAPGTTARTQAIARCAVPASAGAAGQETASTQPNGFSCSGQECNNFEPLPEQTDNADDGGTTAPAPPVVTGITPLKGPVGTQVTISGYFFSKVVSVKFNGVAASFTIVSSQLIRTVVPTGASDGQISLTNAAGATIRSYSYDVMMPVLSAASSAQANTAPIDEQDGSGAGRVTISSFTPTSGAVGTTVTILGSNFTGIISVKFGGVPASFTRVSAQEIRAVVPKGATDGPISIWTEAGGTSTSHFWDVVISSTV